MKNCTLLGLVVFSSCLFSANASATDYTWVGPAGGAWDSGGTYWTTNGSNRVIWGGTTDNAVFNTLGASVAVLNATAWTPLNDLSVISSVNFSGGTVESYGKLSLFSGVTLGVSTYTVSGKILDIWSPNVKINMSAGGNVMFAGQYGTEINLNGVFDSLAATKNYQLISGLGSIRIFSPVSVSGYDKNLFSNVTFDNTGYLTFTAVPEPGTYGIIGACALAGVAVCRRRLKK